MVQRIYVKLLSVTKRGSDPACEVFAIAYAFTYCLGQNPSEQKYRILTMRQKLSMYLERNQILHFPVVQSRLTNTNKQKDNDSHIKQSFEIEMDATTKARLQKRKQKSDRFKRDKENAARYTGKNKKTARKRMKI